MARVLVIEDESDLQEILRYNLGQAGHEVRVAGTGTEGLRLAKAELPDIILLDLMLPDMSGTEICKILRGNPATQHIHIVMITAKGEEIDRVVGFELGADDYVVKPFSVRELLLRIQSVLRRRPMGEAPEAQVRFGVMRVHRTAHRAWIAEQEIELTALEFKLLITLFDRQNRVQTRDTLLADVWGIEADVTTRTVDTHVKRLREKLGKAGQYIETVRGVGYRFSETPDDIAP
jgi:two-component system phosphate regulon response regulator PhoB